MPGKRKDFIKKYVTSAKGTTGGTAYSGRGVGITPGGVGGGDDYKQKIGRGKIPWNLRGFQGSPSMSADAGFSSIVVKRVASPDSVTKSRKPMFPGQDEKDSLEGDIYELDAEDLASEGRMKDKSFFDENIKVENTRYSLVRTEDLMISEDVSWRDMAPDSLEAAIDSFDVRDVIPDPIEDEVLAARDHVVDFLQSVKEKYGDPAFEYVNDKIEDVTGVDPEDTIEKAAEIAKEVARDVVMLAAAGTPIIGTPIAASFILYNLGEMQIGMNQAQRVVDKLVLKGSEFDVDELEKVTSQLYNDYVDFLQAVPYLIPFLGAAKGAASLVTKAARALGGKKSASFVGLGGSGAFGSALRSEIFLSPIFKFITSQADVDSLDDIGIDSSYFFDNVYKVPAALGVLSNLRDEAEQQVSEWESAGRSGTFKFDLQGLEVGDTAAAEERLSQDLYLDFGNAVSDLAGEISSAAESDDIQSVADNIVKETKMSGEDLIRQFIRETIYHSTAGLAAPQPAGYAYRAPHESDPEKDVYEADPGSVVNYKTDMGGVAYSSRPEDLREEALRRIIRRKLQEQKQKKTS